MFYFIFIISIKDDAKGDLDFTHITKDILTTASVAAKELHENFGKKFHAVYYLIIII